MVFTGGGNSVCSGSAYTLKIGSQHPDLLTSMSSRVSQLYERSPVIFFFLVSTSTEKKKKTLPIRIKYIDITS